MAASSTINRFLSLFLPTKQPPSPSSPTPLSLPPPPPPLPSHTLKSSHNLAPLLPQHLSSSELSSVICPSLAYSNTLFFRSPYNNVQAKREVFKARLVQHSTRTKSRLNAKAPSFILVCLVSFSGDPCLKTSAQKKQDVPTTKKEEDEDNSDLPEGDILYNSLFLYACI
ncbi:30S ribosomal protein S21, chloroplastic-like [Abrus precatorius]|uniref:30S ribosomal protein S21, chloroplastic-like n=1 Tax=Abrus precatorius TaxID=3816 RepID=A0A8B8LLA9_ABRPR|nr:30S ribosomal protein S21, chloroplastic-like [Abrus precatorius]